MWWPAQVSVSVPVAPIAIETALVRPEIVGLLDLAIERDVHVPAPPRRALAP